ncbi:AAA family ATPase [Microbacterium sp. P5_E9]
MRGGLERWKRGTESRGVRNAIGYAFDGTCDAHRSLTSGGEALETYAHAEGATVTRFVCLNGRTGSSELDAPALRRWVNGQDPFTGEARGIPQLTEKSDLLLDGTINAPKTYSIAALLHPDLADEFEALQDRLRDRIILTWQRELNARRGHAGAIREELARIEVVELKHRRSRALDPHIHRHLWLNAKVLGNDGKWSTVDSRVAMKFHTVVNAEGELAARTDPEWIAALARRGYTLDADGQIAELTHAVRPLSRRSNQIESNRTTLLGEWHAGHPGQEPSHDILQQIDRRAWALSRPNKPADLDEHEWENLVRHEIAEIDPALLLPRQPVNPPRTPVAHVDRDLLAARAIVDADERSARCGGRFSDYDVRAGTVRAVAASGVVADRATLQELIEDVVVRAREWTIDLLEDESSRPGHIKAYMATATAAAKLDLAESFDALNEPGRVLKRQTIALVAAHALEPDAELDDGQADAAAAVAGTARLVTITGPAGTGKTTMLRVARRALEAQHRRMIVVAPTKKAASVAGRELGAAASSLHALLADHGWRWNRDDAGRETWVRLAIGEADPDSGRIYRGPRTPVSEGDRIVVDEAGMVDLHTAIALARLAHETGAGIAMVGDPLQAAPVGHAGAMACMARRSGVTVEMTCVHRFRDRSYADLTLPLRQPESVEAAQKVAAELDERGLLRRVASEDRALDAMVDGYFHWTGDRKRVALVTATNDEADAVNRAIQQRRIDLGQLSIRETILGAEEQPILRGDIVQTRRNDSDAGVENRALWTVGLIGPGGVELVSLNDSGDVRFVTAEYVSEHVHLGYASTVHGIQGETTDASIVGPGVDAAGLYVGMTRGRLHNEAITIASTDRAAQSQIAASMMRGLPEVSIADSVNAARADLARAARARAEVDAARRAAPWPEASAPFTMPGAPSAGSSISR